MPLLLSSNPPSLDHDIYLDVNAADNKCRSGRLPTITVRNECRVLDYFSLGKREFELV